MDGGTKCRRDTLLEEEYVQHVRFMQQKIVYVGRARRSMSTAGKRKFMAIRTAVTRCRKVYVKLEQ
jgi:hypothetical protein